MPRNSQHITAAVIVAAGKGLRFDRQGKKQFTRVAGHPVISWTLSAFVLSNNIDSIVLVTPAEEIEDIRVDILGKYSFSKQITIIEGGNRRQDSVFLGLGALDTNIRYVAIHDGVRPAVEPAMIDAVCCKAYETGAAVIAIPATDSTFVEKSMRIDRYIDRSELWQAQTPQVFAREAIIKAHKRAKDDCLKVNDDGMIYRRFAGDVSIVEGNASNIKLTYQHDVILLEHILKDRQNSCL